MVCFRSLILMDKPCRLYRLFGCDWPSAVQRVVSQHSCFLEQEHEGALLRRCWVSKWSLSEPASVPKLEPFEIVWPMSDVILVAVMLEEKLLVTEE